MDVHGQPSARVRFGWGPSGAAAVASGADVALVVDVLSFTTTLSVALDHGVEVFPYRWRDEGAAELARARDATLGVGRSQGGRPGTVTLSPGSVRRAAGLRRLVLPSPNGSALCFDLAREGLDVVGACLRNRTAVARWLHRRLSEDGGRAGAVAVVAAGERWPDGSLRPALEDLWGAGAVLAALCDLGVQGLSMEARAAVAAYRDAEPHLDDRLRDCSSGRELVAAGYPDDVAVAGELDGSDVVPLLTGDRFLPAR